MVSIVANMVKMKNLLIHTKEQFPAYECLTHFLQIFFIIIGCCDQNCLDPLKNLAPNTILTVRSWTCEVSSNPLHDNEGTDAQSNIP